MALSSELLTIMTLDNKPFMAALTQAESKVQAFSTSSASAFSRFGALAGGLGAVGVTLFGHEVLKTIANIDELVDTAENLRIGVEQFQELSFAAEQLGSSTESLTGILTRMQKTIGDAAGGNKAAIESFQKIGLSVQDLIGLSPDQQLKKIGSAIAGIDDQNRRAAASFDIFGKQGGKNLAFITSNLDEATDKARKFGQVISEDNAKKVAELNDKFKELKGSMFAAFGSLIAEATPAINSLIDLFTKLLHVTSEIDNAVIGMGKEMVGIGAYDPNERKSKFLFDQAKFDAAGTTMDSFNSLASQKSNRLSPDKALAGFMQTDKEQFDQIVNNLKTRDQILTTSFNGLDSAINKASNSLQDFYSRMDQLENLKTGRYDEQGGKPQLKSEEFDDIARDLINRQLSGTLTTSSAKQRLSELKSITEDNLQYNEKTGELDEVSTSGLKSDLKQLQELLLGSKGKNEIAITVNSAPELDAKIEKISENSFTNILTKEATGVNR
jgi:hypothetical protein